MAYLIQVPGHGWHRKHSPGAHSKAIGQPHMLVNHPINDCQRIAVLLVKDEAGDVRVEQAWREYLQEEGGDTYWVEGEALDTAHIDLSHKQYHIQLPANGWQHEHSPGAVNTEIEPPHMLVYYPIDECQRIAVLLVKDDTGDVCVEQAWMEYLQEEGNDIYWDKGEVVDTTHIHVATDA